MTKVFSASVMVQYLCRVFIKMPTHKKQSLTILAFRVLLPYNFKIVDYETCWDNLEGSEPWLQIC
ncbi:hypothetical protein SCFA_2460014 [anaerobic digester metagenome]|uniref:Uncharacterized protein n=1 Tax=anaerobic digester metagenome TaxID=1263854 RepID=A0A485M1D3_9ZZZZ